MQVKLELYVDSDVIAELQQLRRDAKDIDISDKVIAQCALNSGLAQEIDLARRVAELVKDQKLSIPVAAL